MGSAPARPVEVFADDASSVAATRSRVSTTRTFFCDSTATRSQMVYRVSRSWVTRNTVRPRCRAGYGSGCRSRRADRVEAGGGLVEEQDVGSSARGAGQGGA